MYIRVFFICAKVIKKGDRIAQGAFFNFLVADTGNTDSKRVGGFGSTGVK